MRRFFSHTIPNTPWRASNQWSLAPSRLLILSIGLIIFGIGDGLLIVSHLGNAPWSVLAQGLSFKTGISIGWATFAVSSAVLVLWIPFRQKPGAGTIANILLIALAIDLTVAWIDTPENLLLRACLMIFGVIMVGAGSNGSLFPRGGKRWKSRLRPEIQNRIPQPGASEKAVIARDRCRSCRFPHPLRLLGCSLL